MTCSDLQGTSAVHEIYDQELGRWVEGYNIVPAAPSYFDWIEIAEDTAQVRLQAGNALRSFSTWLSYDPFNHYWSHNGSYDDDRPAPIRRAYFVPGPGTGVVPLWTWFWDCSTAIDSPDSGYLWHFTPADTSAERSPGFHFTSPDSYIIEQYILYNMNEPYASYGAVTTRLPEAPTGGIGINDGSGYASSPNVTLSLNYAATATEMRFKQIPGLNLWTNWQPVSPSRNWTFTPLYVGESPDGLQTIYCSVP
jgi:hypothetical protein